jgi:MFS family permease
VGAAAGWISVAALVQRWFSMRRLGMALGIVTVGTSFGYGLMGIILPILFSAHGWRFCWFFLGCLALTLMVVNGLLLRSKPEDVGLKPGGTSKRASDAAHKEYSKKEILYTARFWEITISYLSISFAIQIVMFFLVTYVNLELMINYVTAAGLMSIIAFSGVAGNIIFPVISDYIGRKKVLMICNGVIAGNTLGFVMVGQNIFGLMALAAIYGLAFQGIWATYGACASDYFSPRVAGSVLGLWTIFYGVGALTSPIIAGYIADVLNSFFWAFILGGIFATIAVVFLTPLKTLRTLEE